MNNYVSVLIEGNNVENYINWLIKNKYHIIDLDIIDIHHLKLVVAYQDLAYLSKYSKTYKVTILKKYGFIKIIDYIKKHKIILISLIIGIFFLYYIKGFILSIDIIYNNEEINSLIRSELKKYGIDIYKRKLSWSELLQVKEQILNNNKSKLEWLEIEEKGTKYIIRLVERKQNKEETGYLYQSIIAKKEAIITSVYASSGERLKKVADYVHKGDTIISGIIVKPNGEYVYTKASGKVIGEVWYKITIESPLHHKEEIYTGRKRRVLTINFRNYHLSLFPFKNYKHFKREVISLLSNNIIPISISFDKLYEINIKDYLYTKDELVIKSKTDSIQKLKERNKAIVDIKDVKIISEKYNNSKLKITFFISAYEDITALKEEKMNEIIDN